MQALSTGEIVKRYISLLTIVLFLAITAASAVAQNAPAAAGDTSTTQDTSTAQTESKHRIEITPYGGYVWTHGYDVLLGGQKGNLDVRESAVWGVTVGYSLRDSLTQIELIYSRQDADVYFEFSGQDTSYGEVSIEHLHVGALLGTASGRTVWFTTLSLGASRWAPKDGEADDAWRFSLIFGLGAKYPISERFGLRFQARLPYMFVEDSAKFACGPSGCLNSAGGRAIWQFDMSVGLIIKL